MPKRSSSREEELKKAIVDAWALKNDAPISRKWEITDLVTGIEPVRWLRTKLPMQFRCIPDEQFRRVAFGLSKGGDMASGEREKPSTTPLDKMRNFLGKASKIARDTCGESLSDEYLEYINSEVWRERASRHKAECEFTCQLCGKSDGSLDVHHVLYPPLNGNFDGNELSHLLLCVCPSPCHEIADAVRIVQEVAKHSKEFLPLFA